MRDDHMPTGDAPLDDEAVDRFLDAPTGESAGETKDNASPGEATAAALERFYRQGATPLPSAMRDRAWREVRYNVANEQIGRQRAVLPPHPGEPARDIHARNVSPGAWADGADMAANPPARRAVWLRPISYAASAMLIGLTFVVGLMTVRMLIDRNDSPRGSAALLSGNGGAAYVSTFRGNNARTGSMPGLGPGIPATRLWVYDIGVGSLGSPAVVGGVVYATGGTYVGSDWTTQDPGDGMVVALDAKTGDVQWRTDLDGFVGTSPAFVDGLLYVATEGGTLVALDAKTGAVRWQYRLASRPFNSSPAVEEGIVVINSGGVTSSPAVADGVVYVGSGRTEQGAETVTSAVDAATGVERWQFTNRENGFYALDAETGAVRWSFPTRTLSGNSAAIYDDAAFVVDAGSHTLFELDLETGTAHWQLRLAAGGAYATPAVANGLVYVTDQLGNLYAVDTRNGAERWRYVADALVNASPVIANDLVYLADRLGNVVVIDAATGRELGAIANAGEIGHGAVAAPAIAGGLLYLARADGEIAAFGPSPTAPP